MVSFNKIYALILLFLAIAGSYGDIRGATTYEQLRKSIERNATYWNENIPQEVTDYFNARIAQGSLGDQVDKDGVCEIFLQLVWYRRWWVIKYVLLEIPLQAEIFARLIAEMPDHGRSDEISTLRNYINHIPSFPALLPNEISIQRSQLNQVNVLAEDLSRIEVREFYFKNYMMSQVKKVLLTHEDTLKTDVAGQQFVTELKEVQDYVSLAEKLDLIIVAIASLPHHLRPAIETDFKLFADITDNVYQQLVTDFNRRNANYGIFNQRKVEAKKGPEVVEAEKRLQEAYNNMQKFKEQLAALGTGNKDQQNEIRNEIRDEITTNGATALQKTRERLEVLKQQKNELDESQQQKINLRERMQLLEAQEKQLKLLIDYEDLIQKEEERNRKLLVGGSVIAFTAVTIGVYFAIEVYHRKVTAYQIKNVPRDNLQIKDSATAALYDRLGKEPDGKAKEILISQCAARLSKQKSFAQRVRDIYYFYRPS